MPLLNCESCGKEIHPENSIKYFEKGKRSFFCSKECIFSCKKIGATSFILWSDSTYIGINEDSLDEFEEAEIYSAVEDLELAEENLKKDPKDFYSLFKKSDSFLTLGLYQESLDTINTALEICPNDPSALIQKGNCLMNLKKLEEASTIFDFVIKNYPENESVWTYKAICLEYMGKFNENLDIINRALELDPTDDFFYDLKELTLGLLGKPKEELLNDLERGLEASPGNCFLWNQKGKILLENGRYSEALETFEIAISINQSNYSAWNYRGKILGILGGYDEGVKAYDEAINKNPEVAELYSAFGNYCSSFDKYEEAIKAFNESIAVDPHNDSVWISKINILDKLNRTVEKFEAINKAISENPKSDILFCEKGFFLMSIKRYEEALEAFNRANSIDPLLNATHKVKGICQLILKKYEDAVKSFEGALVLDSVFEVRDDEIWNYKGIALRNLLRYEEALEAFDEAAQIKNESIYFANKAFVLEELGRHEDSLSIYNSLITKEPENPEFYCIKSLILHKMGNLPEAIKCSKKIHEINPRYEIKDGVSVMEYLLELQEEFVRKREREGLCETIKKMEQMMTNEFEERKGTVNMLMKHLDENNKQIKSAFEEQNNEIKSINRNVTSANNKLNYLVDEAGKITKEITDIKNEYKTLPPEEKIKCIEEKIDSLIKNMLFDGQRFEEYLTKASIKIEKWDKLENKSKTYLAISEYLYFCLNRMREDEIDYSPVVLQTCRSLENELKEKIFLNYFWYLSSHQETLEDIYSDDYSKFEEQLFDDLNRFLNETQKEKVTIRLGISELCLVLEELQSPQSNFHQSLKSFISQNFILSKIIDTEFLHEIVKICKTRNNSAHSGTILSKETAEKIMKKNTDLINSFLNSKK